MLSLGPKKLKVMFSTLLRSRLEAGPPDFVAFQRGYSDSVSVLGGLISLANIV